MLHYWQITIRLSIWLDTWGLDYPSHGTVASVLLRSIFSMISTPYLLISANTSVTLISQALPLIKSRHLGRLVPVLPMLRALIHKFLELLSNAQKINYFYTGLKDSIKDLLVGTDCPVTFDRYFALCTEFDNWLHKWELECKQNSCSSSSQPNNNNPPTTTPLHLHLLLCTLLKSYLWN